MRTESGIRFWIPHVVVRAVEDALEYVSPLSQDPIESKAKLWRTDLFSVRRTDCTNAIGVRNPGFHEVHEAQKFDTSRLKEGPWQPCQAKGPCREQTLISKVMDGEDRARCGNSTVQPWQKAKIGRHKTGMPIVTM